MHQLRRPLDALLKKDVKFIWSQECHQAFEKFKTTLQSDLLLTHYDPSLDNIVAADALKSGISAVIMHRFPDGSLKAIAHASRTLTSAGSDGSKALAPNFGLQKGYSTTYSESSPTLGALLCYDFDIQYVSTNQFGYADILSRLISSHTKTDEDFIIASLQLEEDVEVLLDEAMESLPVSFKLIQRVTSKCPVLQQVTEFTQKGWPSDVSSIQHETVKQFHSNREAV
ncbi:uncharacterized protein LOC129738290 [Uranotaenia lowii]|uniref:uncharacterized protein LOC129738290 n=1 Tax=Uranotaenia lowii TaxID=190385 RepID=UPI002478DC0A|nr:uncharacterized protein LOC129738290 [Uranotaenia lowii]